MSVFSEELYLTKALSIYKKEAREGTGRRKGERGNKQGMQREGETLI